MSVFEGCRVFRESEIEEDKTTDFTNMVIFCKAGSWFFRETVEADFLLSQARRHSLPPRYEIGESKLMGARESQVVLSKSNLNLLRRTERRSAEDHWRIMRTVLPGAVWVNW